MACNSKQKGARGERDLAKEIEKCLGISARRSQQYHGLSELGDVVIDSFIHCEVKRVERLNISNAMKQSIMDASRNPKNPVPTVFHRKDREDWMVTLPLKELSRFIRIMSELIEQQD